MDFCFSIAANVCVLGKIKTGCKITGRTGLFCSGFRKSSGQTGGRSC